MHYIVPGAPFDRVRQARRYRLSAQLAVCSVRRRRAEEEGSQQDEVHLPHLRYKRLREAGHQLICGVCYEEDDREITLQALEHAVMLSRATRPDELYPVKTPVRRPRSIPRRPVRVCCSESTRL